jgi:Undecaprenyl-phosphate glucose phosphotransferase
MSSPSDFAAPPFDSTAPPFAKNQTGSQFSAHKQSLFRLVPFSHIASSVLCCDLAVIVSMSIATSVIYHLFLIGEPGPVEIFFGVGALTGVNFCIILSSRGAYQPHRLVDFWRQLRETSWIWVVAFFLLSLLAFSFKVSATYSRGTILIFFVAGWFAIAISRLIIGRSMARAIAEGGFAEQKTILLAETELLNGVSVIPELQRYGYCPSRTYELSPQHLASLHESGDIRRSINEMLELSRREPIRCVFLLLSWNNLRAVEQILTLLRVLSLPVYLLPDRNVAELLKNRIVQIGPACTAELKRAPLTTSEQAHKRAFDLVLSLTLLVLLAPLILLVAVLIKLDSRGPIFFKQTRNGFNGRPFKIFKFRTMSVLEDGPVIRQATKDDPRVTHVGRLLRRVNVDELPQLFNVIAGDMALVGPRPHAAAHNSEYEQIIGNYAHRYHVKPGLTGWAQVNGLRGETQSLQQMAKRVEFDLWYINNWSPWLDFRIMLQTLFVGLQPTAY